MGQTRGEEGRGLEVSIENVKTHEKREKLKIAEANCSFNLCAISFQQCVERRQGVVVQGFLCAARKEAGCVSGVRSKGTSFSIRE